jgi:hypothetical protein
VAARDPLPPLPDAAFACLVGLLLVLWLTLRVWILRRRAARREEGEPDVSAPRWLRAVALARWTDAVLLVLGLALAAGLWLSIRAS